MAKYCGIPALMYHAVSSDNFRSTKISEEDHFYTISESIFESQIKYFIDNNYVIDTISNIKKSSKKAEKYLVITFDDSYVSNCSVVLPILNKYNVKAVFYLTVGDLGKKSCLSNDQVRKIAESGMEIGSHTLTHRFLDDLSYVEIKNELSESKEILEKITGSDIKSISFPGGRYNQDVINAMHEIRFDYGASSEIGLSSTDDFIWNRMVVTKNTSLEKISKYISGDKYFLKKSAFRNKLLKSMKKILGNSLYKNIHNILTKGKH